MKYHTGNRMYECEHCDTKCVTNAEMIRHRRTHTGEKPYQCGTCGKTFSYESNLKSHKCIKFRDSSEKPHECGVCGKKFKFPSILKNHKCIY